jgi:hypothetical protein
LSAGRKGNERLFKKKIAELLKDNPLVRSAFILGIKRSGKGEV